MKRLLFCRIYCDLSFVATLIMIFYTLQYIYVDPIFFLKIIALTALACLLLTGVIVSLYILITLGKISLPSYRAQLILFQVEFFILIGALIVSTISENDSLVINGALPFMIIFACVSFFLLRTSRDPDNRASEKHNAISTAIIMVVLLLCTNVVREALFKMPFLSILNVNLRFDIKQSSGGGGGGGAPPREQHVKNKITHLASGPDLKKIIIFCAISLISIAFIILLIHLIVRYRRAMKSRRRNPTVARATLYDENREFIRSGSNNSNAKRRIPWPRDYRTTVRACYAKFMRLCKDKSVEIKPSDTTGQINEKYGAKYPAEAADALRSIYVRVRYSNETASKELAEQSMAEYRQIRQGASGAKGQGI